MKKNRKNSKNVKNLIRGVVEIEILYKIASGHFCPKRSFEGDIPRKLF